MGVVDMDTGRPLPPDVQSMSAYLGYEWCTWPFISRVVLLIILCIVIPFSLVGHFQLPRLLTMVLTL